MLSNESTSLKMGYKFLTSAIDFKMQPDPLSDNSLMLKVREGDLQKLALLFERYKNILFSYFYRMSGNRESAEDLVQTVFIRIIKYKHAYRGDGSFKTWIFHIARNIQIDHWRKEKKWQNKITSDGLEERLTENIEDNNKEIHLRILEKALDQLPLDKKELIVLSKLKGLRYKDIAEAMDLPEPVVKTRAFRALKALKLKYVEIEKDVNYGRSI